MLRIDDRGQTTMLNVHDQCAALTLFNQKVITRVEGHLTNPL